MFKQICFFRKRPDMTMDEFLDYYENQHSQLSKRQGRAPSLPNAQRYVRRYLTPEKNPVTGEVHDCGYDCLMEIWWNSRADFEASQAIISDPARLPMINCGGAAACRAGHWRARWRGARSPWSRTTGHASRTSRLAANCSARLFSGVSSKTLRPASIVVAIAAR